MDLEMDENALYEKQKCVEAYAELVIEDGIKSPTYTQVARKAGVPVKHLFTYFTTIDGMVVEIGTILDVAIKTLSPGHLVTDKTDIFELANRSTDMAEKKRIYILAMGTFSRLYLGLLISNRLESAVSPSGDDNQQQERVFKIDQFSAKTTEMAMHWLNQDANFTRAEFESSLFREILKITEELTQQN